MRKILLQLDTDPQPSVFDAVTALVSTDCTLLRHGNITPDNVVGLVHGAMFTRPTKEINNTAIFIGGSNIETSEAILQKVKETIWPPLNISVVFDPNGSNTTAASAVYNINSALPLAGKKMVILSGTGPVGQRAAGMALRLGANILVTSRKEEKAKTSAEAIEKRFGKPCEYAAMAGPSDLPIVLNGADVAFCCGAAGIELLPQEVWENHPTLKVVADVNAVPPFGLGGTTTTWCGEKVNGKTVFGAIGIGWLKMKIHHLAIERVFDKTGQIFDAEAIYDLAEDAIKQ